MFDELKLEETTVDSKEVYSGRLLHVFKDKILLPNNTPSTREYIKHLGAVCIVALNEQGKVAIERQYRYPFHREMLEIPAGKLDSAEEDHLEAAKRELREETGIIAQEYTYLGELYPSVAYTTEVIYIYLAQKLTQGERQLDDDENINWSFMPLDELVQMIMEGKIGDAKTQLAILKADKYLKTK